MPKVGGHVVSLRSLRGVQKNDVLIVTAEGCDQSELEALRAEVGNRLAAADIGAESIIANFYFDVKVVDRNRLELMLRQIQDTLEGMDNRDHPRPRKSRAKQMSKATLLRKV